MRNRLAEAELIAEPLLTMRPGPAREIAVALRRVRDDRLYREDYDTFRDYCEAKGIPTEAASFMIALLEDRERLERQGARYRADG